MPDKRRNHHTASENLDAVENLIAKANEIVAKEAAEKFPPLPPPPKRIGVAARGEPGYGINNKQRAERLRKAREYQQERLLTDYDAKRVNRILREIALKDMEATKLYEPMPHQLAFHKSQAPERIVLGGNRCLGGEQMIFDPVAGIERRVDEIDGPFHVWSMNPETGEMVIRQSSKPFVKGRGSLYQVDLSNGESLVTTLEHRIVAADGKWVSVQRAFSEQIELVQPEEDRPSSSAAKVFHTSHQAGQPLPQQTRASIASPSTPQQMEVESAVCVGGHAGQVSSYDLLWLRESHSSVLPVPRNPLRNRPLEVLQGRGRSSARLQAFDAYRHRSNSESCLSALRQDAPDCRRTVQGYLDDCLLGRHPCDEQPQCQSGSDRFSFPSPIDVRERSHARMRPDDSESIEAGSHPCRSSHHPSSMGDARHSLVLSCDFEDQDVSSPYRQETPCNQLPFRSDRVSSSDRNTSVAESLNQASEIAFESLHPLHFNCSNSSNSCRITSVTYLREDAIWDVHVDEFSNYVAGRLVNANCGKTLCTAMELTWAVLGCHPYIDYPKEGGRAIVVGKDLSQLAQVFWRKLTRREPTFRMITDLETGAWRAFRPYDPSDLLRKAESKPMLRLIPERYVKKIAWEDKARDVPSMITLTTGWEILFKSGVGKPPRGLDVDLVLFDEEIPDSDFYPEMAARLVDRNGRFVWGATPQAGTDQLYALHERALDEIGKENPLCEEFKVKLHENQFLTPEQRTKLMAKYADSPEEYRVRIEGEFLSTSFLVYPNFSMSRHGFPWFEIPDHWMRIAVFDPGFANFACLMFAIPPPGEKHNTKTRDGKFLKVDGDHVYLYDEIFLKNSDIKTIGDACKQKLSGQNFHAFIIDRHHSIKHETSGKRIEVQYQEQFEQHGLKSRISGSGFIYGNDDVIAGVERVRSWLWQRDGAPPKLRVLEGIAPWFEREMKRYFNVKVGGKVKTPIKPDQTKNNHTMDALRYAVCYDPKYEKPVVVAKRSPAVTRFLAKRKKARHGGAINVGPAS